MATNNEMLELRILLKDGKVIGFSGIIVGDGVTVVPTSWKEDDEDRKLAVKVVEMLQDVRYELKTEFNI